MGRWERGRGVGARRRLLGYDQRESPFGAWGGLSLGRAGLTTCAHTSMAEPFPLQGSFVVWKPAARMRDEGTQSPLMCTTYAPSLAVTSPRR